MSGSAGNIRRLEEQVALRPASAVAEHNLAAALGDAGDAGGALAAIRRAFAKGGDAPESWLVHARALVSLSRLAEAETALVEALRRRPDYADALRDQAQLIWMRTGDARAATALIEERLTREPTPQLIALRAAIVRDIIDDEDAYRGLEPWLKTEASASLDLIASMAASGFDPALALAHAERAAQTAPEYAGTRLNYSASLMACGRFDEAIARLDAHLSTAPDDQYALALRYVAWRVLGDPRALSAEDYRRLTAAYDLEPPAGRDRGEWLKAVAMGLRALHPFRAQPLNQSIRSGVQAALDPRYAGDPAIDAIFGALEAPIGRFVADMADRTDPMSRRAGTGHEIVGAWSVRLTAGGRHSDHIHPNGWVSSALYVETPEPSPDQPKAGWLRFGACRLGVGLELPPEHWIEPRPGRVALFPSWMWHGTEPFTGGGERLTVAFDVQPR